MKETGFCSELENYSRHLTGLAIRAATVYTDGLLEMIFLLIIDESHKTVPQVGGMYAGVIRAVNRTLVDYGFRLPSAKDNRPLSFDEFENKLDQVMFVSATPGEYEYDHDFSAQSRSSVLGLLDPKVEVRRSKDRSMILQQK